MKNGMHFYIFILKEKRKNMKKITYLMGILLILSLLLTGCNDLAETQPNNPEETPINTPVETPEETPIETPAETPAELIPEPLPEFDLSKLPEDLRSNDVYGEFNGVYVLDIANAKAICSEEVERVADYCFIYPDANFLDVYDSSNGKYYELTEAYEKGLLSDENIKSVNELFKKANPLRYADGNRPKSRLTWPLDGIGTSKIYAEFSYTVIGKYDYNPYYKVAVAGYEFNLLGDEKIVISYNREKYTLNQAYDAKLITDEDVKLIHQRWVERYDGTYW